MIRTVAARRREPRTSHPMHSLLPRIAPLAAILALVLPGSAGEAAAPPDQPLLWRVEGPGLTTPSHLFGTIHLSTPRIARLHPAAQRAFDAADALVTEISLDPQAQLTGSAVLMRGDGGTLSASAGPEVMKALDQRLKAINPALGTEVFDPMKTWAAAAGAVMLPHQLKGGQALDQILWNLATKGGKKASGLETMKEQAAAFEVLDEKEQVAYLRETLASWDKNEALMARMIAAYEKGDADAIGALMVESIRDFGEDEASRKLGEKLLKSLLTDRDLRMAERIDALLRRDPTQSRFIAIGAAHLIGDTSVRKHLETRGYRIERVTR